MVKTIRHFSTLFYYDGPRSLKPMMPTAGTTLPCWSIRTRSAVSATSSPGLYPNDSDCFVPAAFDLRSLLVESKPGRTLHGDR